MGPHARLVTECCLSLFLLAGCRGQGWSPLGRVGHPPAPSRAAPLGDPVSEFFLLAVLWALF